MKEIAIMITTLCLLAAPALADTVHHDGPGSSSTHGGYYASHSENRSDSYHSRMLISDRGASAGDRATHRGVNSKGVLVTVDERLNR